MESGKGAKPLAGPGELKGDKGGPVVFVGGEKQVRCYRVTMRFVGGGGWGTIRAGRHGPFMRRLSWPAPNTKREIE